jgi:hypothetical protein
MKETKLLAPDWKGASAYLLVLFGLTWPVEIMALLRGVRFPADQPNPTAQFLLLGVSLVPAIAAWLVVATLTKESLSFTGLRFGDWRYYALTWLAVPWLYIATYWLSAIFGFGTFDSSFHAVATFLSRAGGAGSVQQYLMLALAFSLSISILVYALPAFFEQYGWIGFLLPKLLPLGRWQATLICGFLRGFWQLPLIAAGYAYTDRLAGYVMIVLYMCALSLVECALRIRSNSVLLPTFFETMLRAQGRGVIPMAVLISQPLFGGMTGLVGLILLAGIGAYLLATASQEAVDALCIVPRKAKTPEWLKRRRR